MLDNYNRIPYNYKSKIGYDFVMQNIILKEMIKLMGAIVTVIEIEIK